MRQIIMDTETTGIDPKQGHRLVEIGCVEMIDRKLTGNNYHVYINPERIVEQEVIDVHGLTNEFLADKPLFKEVAQDFVEFVNGAELVIHNAPFDIGFLDHELAKLKRGYPKLADICSIVDTLVMARKMHPGQKNNLDALCKRYYVDNSSRTLHGALLDSEILADVYLAMTGGQTNLILAAHGDEGSDGEETIRRLSADRPALRILSPTADELQHHQRKLEEIAGKSGNCLWLTDE